jgi:hypothetical protein
VKIYCGLPIPRLSPGPGWLLGSMIQAWRACVFVCAERSLICVCKEDMHHTELLLNISLFNYLVYKT